MNVIYKTTFGKIEKGDIPTDPIKPNDIDNWELIFVNINELRGILVWTWKLNGQPSTRIKPTY